MVAHEGGNEILLVGEERYVVVWRSEALGGWGSEYKINDSNNVPDGDGWWADGAWTVGANPVAIVVHRGWPDDFSTTSGSGRIHWGKYQASKWSNGAPLKVPGMGVLSWPQLEPLSGSRVIGVFSDDQGNLWAATHDTTTWSLPGGNPVGAGLATPVTRVFSIDIRR